jgi:hypothetical protein
MSIISSVRIEEDMGYPALAWHALHLYRLGDHDGLFRLVMEMNLEQPLRPYTELRYRKPVWDAIAVEIDKVNAVAHRRSMKEKADWLLEQLKMCDKYWRFQKRVANFLNEVRSLGFTEQDVAVTGEFQARGEAATQVVTRIVESLLPVFAEMIEKKKTA